MTLAYTYSEVYSETEENLCKKVFLKISQNSQEKSCARVSFLIKLLRIPFLTEHLRWRYF